MKRGATPRARKPGAKAGGVPVPITTGSPVGAPAYPSHDAELDALARIEGQIRGIRKMIEERRYCVDILTQTRAAHAAMRRVERNILEAHLRTCVRSAMCSESSEEREQKVQEVLRLFDCDEGAAVTRRK